MPARARRWRLFFASGGGALVAAGGIGAGLLFAWLHSDDFQHRASRAIERVVEARSGEQLSLNEVSVEFWPPALEVAGVNLWDHETGDTIVSAQRVRAPLVIRDGRPALGQLQLIAPVVQLHLDEKGKLLEFDARPPRDPDAKPLSELPWSSLRVVDGTFRLVSPRGEVEVGHINVSPVGDTDCDVSARVALRSGEFEDVANIAWQGVQIGPDVIHVPEIDLEFGIIDISGEADVPLQGDLEVRLKGEARLDALDPLFEPPWKTYGTVQYDIVVSGPPADPRVEATLVGDDLGLDKPGRRFPLLQHRLGDMHAALSATRDGIEIETAAFVWGDGKATISGRITPDLKVEKGHLRADSVSLAKVLADMDAFKGAWADVIITGDADLSGELKPLSLRGVLDTQLADLRVHDRDVFRPDGTSILEVPYGTLAGTWSVDLQDFILDAEKLTTPRSRGTAHMTMSTMGGPTDITATLRTGDLSELRPMGGSDLHGVGPLTVRVHGENGLFWAKGRADVDGFVVTGLPYADHLGCDVASPDMHVLKFTSCNGRKGGTPYTGDIALDFRPPMSMDLQLNIPLDGRIEDVTGVFLELEGLRGNMGGTLHLRGPLNDLSGEADVAMAAVDLWGERFPTGSAHGYMDAGVFTLDDMRVSRGEGDGLVLRGGVDRAWALNMELVGNGRVERLDHVAGMKAPIAGRWSVATRIDNTLFEPAPHGRIALTDVRYAGRPVEDSLVRFNTTEGVAHYKGFAVGDTVALDGTIGLWGEQPYLLDATFRDFPAHLAYPVAADGGRVTATLSGALALSGHVGDDPSPIDIVADATDVQVRWAGQQLRNDGAWHYEQHGRAFALDRFALFGGTTRFGLSASGGDKPLEVAGSGQIDTDLLRMVVPGLERSDGTAEVTVTANGTPPDVNARVNVTLDGALVRHASFPGNFEDVHLVATGGRDGYDLWGDASLGGGNVKLGSPEAPSHIAAEAWYPKRFNLEVQAQDAQVRWVDWLPPVIGDGRLAFDGPIDALLLSGRVDIDEMVFADRIDWEDWVVEWKDELLVDALPTEATSAFSFDVAVNADQTIRLRNNIAEGSASAKLRVIGDTARPGLVGTVDVTNATAYLQDREFDVDRGMIAFRDPWTWDPDLDFDLVTDIASRERRYRVNYLVTGPFSNWRSESRSDPGLPQADVNALLWFGMTADELEAIGELPQAIGQGVADMLLADFVLTSQTAKDLRGELPALFDRVDLVTGVNARGEYSPDPRLLIEKRLDQMGGLDVTAEIDLARASDQYYRIDAPLTNGWSLSGWYATRQRDRNLPIGGAYGVDLRARWDSE